ncbi:hypothetical protein EVAR_2922_1 [Eumeta japonica]|uniref:Uncharacterized protein n=1 Tax=Eumeta variegata TaxID=151549 RepID=A0A4C1T100_EUMVA|nr:hypothetical protein EVAR_2922_1 [Eumeta japonica]
MELCLGRRDQSEAENRSGHYDTTANRCRMGPTRGHFLVGFSLTVSGRAGVRMHFYFLLVARGKKKRCIRLSVSGSRAARSRYNTGKCATVIRLSVTNVCLCVYRSCDAVLCSAMQCSVLHNHIEKEPMSWTTIHYLSDESESDFGSDDSKGEEEFFTKV